MNTRLGIRDGLISAMVFGSLLMALTMFDPRVRDRMGDLFAGRNSVTRLSDRVVNMGDALWSSARSQSIEHAPLVVFAAIGAVLTLFMLKS